MAIQDTPIKSGQQQIKDQPVKPTNKGTKSSDRDFFEANQIAMLQNYLKDTTVSEAFNQYRNDSNKEGTLRRLAAEKSGQDQTDLTEEFVKNPYGESGDIEIEATGAQIAYQQLLDEGIDPDKHYAETLVGDQIDFEAIKREAGRAKMYKMLSDMQEETDWGDITMDVASDFIPFKESQEGYNLTGQYFGQDDQIRQAIVGFKRKPVEEQVEIFPILRDELEDKIGPSKTMQILGNMLAPLGQEKDVPLTDIDKLWDAVDLAGFAAPVAFAMRGIKQGYNTAKSAKSVGNEDLATEASIASAADPDIGRATNMDQTTATGNMLPFDTSIEDIGHQGGLSGSTVAKLAEFFGESDVLAQDIISGKSFLKEGIVNTNRRAELEADAYNRLKAERAEDIKISAEDENVTTFSYKVRDEDGNISEETYDLHLTLNDAGYWDQEVLPFGASVSSPTAFAKGLLREDVDTAQRIDYLSSKINRELNTMTRKALEPIGLIPTPKNRKSLAKVDHALREGDEFKNADGTRGKVFRVDELKENYGLEENEISAYYRINRLYNNLFNIRNHEKRQEMVARGFKHVNFTRNNEAMVGKAFDDASSAAGSVRTNNANFLYDEANDTIINLKEKGEGFYSDMYANGNRIVRLDDAYDIGGDRGKVLYALVHESDVTDLPDVVLHRKEGYVPRDYENNSYFVKEITEDVVDGDKPFTQRRTLRFFDNKVEADEYVEQLVRRDVERAVGSDSPKLREYNKKMEAYEKARQRFLDGKRKTEPKLPKRPDFEGAAKAAEELARKRYKALGDREEEILSASTGDVGHGSNGLYTGARAQDDILFGLEGTKPTRLNSFEALTRNIGNISKFASINQWRLGLEQRWINTVNRMFEAKGKDFRVDRFTRLSPDSEAADEVAFLNKMYDQIRDWQGFATKEERVWQATVQNMYDWAMSGAAKSGGVKKYGYEKAGKLLGNLRNTDPIATARATAFHSLLGWFNFSQLWVQMQGMAVAASVGAGKYLGRTLNQSIALSMLDTGREGIVKAGKLLARASDMDEAELLKLHELWKKTGYRDSVLQTADHAAASQGYGMSMDLFRRASDQGLIFYRTGELTNRRLSFTTAIERWKEKRVAAGKSSNLTDIDDKALKGIMDDANNMMLNMGRANRAQWQKGFLSLPFQFLQVTTKFAETATGMNRNFTGAERARMFATQLALYGTAGVPVAGLGIKFMAETMGVTQQEIEDNPTLVKAINDGFWGVSTYWMLGADIELSSRGSLLRGVGDFVDNWFVQESSVAEKLLGAFGATGTRFWDSFTHRMKPFTLGGMQNVDWEDGAKLLVSPFLDTISTSRNIIKAEYMSRLDQVYSRNGRVLDTHDFSFTEEMAQRLGFQPTRQAETYDLVQRTQAADSLKKEVTVYVTKTMNEFAYKYPNGGYSEQEFADYQRDIQAALGVLYPDEVMDVMNSIDQSIKSGSRRSEAIQRAMETVKENTAAEASTWRATLIGNKVLRYGLETEEQE